MRRDVITTSQSEQGQLRIQIQKDTRNTGQVRNSSAGSIDSSALDSALTELLITLGRGGDGSTPTKDTFDARSAIKLVRYRLLPMFVVTDLDVSGVLAVRQPAHNGGLDFTSQQSQSENQDYSSNIFRRSSVWKFKFHWNRHRLFGHSDHDVVSRWAG